jgi:hypothetical protein
MAVNQGPAPWRPVRVTRWRRDGRFAADPSGFTREKRPGALDRGTVLVLTTAPIALGATSMSDVAMLRHT